MVESPLLDALLLWAQQQPAIDVVTLFGSRARGVADASSDIDLQVVTRAPECFLNENWTKHLAGQTLHAYGVRPATGGAQKVTALFAAGEVDLVIVPLARLRLARLMVNLGLHRRPGTLRTTLSNLSVVMRPAHRVVKGGAKWAQFYEKVVADVPDPRVSDQEARALATTAYIDAVWVVRKAARGELVAAQRWLHKTPVEVNFRLLNEWRARRGQKMCFDARRAEQILPPEELALIVIESELDASSLTEAARRSVVATRQLLHELTGEKPDWPAL